MTAHSRRALDGVVACRVLFHCGKDETSKGEGMDGQHMKMEMMRLVSEAAVLASGVGLGLSVLFVALAALLQ